MTAQSTKQKPRKSLDPASNQAKGNLLEDIVARLYEAPNLTVEKKQFLPATDDPARTREIDVLVAGSFAGYPMRIAIECKNYKEPVGIDRIDSFIGKLADVGIPPQYGIFVAVNGYESGVV